LAVLDALLPLTFVPASIAPIHLTEPMSQIVKVFPLINVSSYPSEHAVATFFIVSVLTFVFIGLSWASFPYSITVSQSIFEVTFEKVSFGPEIFTVTRRLAVFIRAIIAVSVGELFSPFSVLQAALKLSLIAISVNPGVNSIAICLSEFPLSYI